MERCVRSGPKKLTKTYNKGSPNHSTLINHALTSLLVGCFILSFYLYFKLYFICFSRLPFRMMRAYGATK